jgi:hypothetical protein
VAAGLDVLDQQVVRPEGFAQGLVQELEDRQADVQAHQVDHLERSHRVVQAELQGGVDVLGRRHPLLEHAERLVADQALIRLVTKPGASRTVTTVLPIRSATSGHHLERLLGGLQAAHQLHQLHQVDRIEEVHAGEPLGLPEAAAISVIDSAEVLEAKRASAGARRPPGGRSRS